MSRMKTTELKMLQGNRGKRRLNPDMDLALEAGAPEPPDDLGEEARAYWNRLVRVLAPERVLTEADFGALLLVCHSYEHMMALQRALEKKKSFVYRERGSMGQLVEKKRPEVGMLQAARRQFFRFSQELGLTPTSRGHVHKAKPAPKKPNPVDEFFT